MLAWNRPELARVPRLLAQLPPGERNLLELLFSGTTQLQTTHPQECEQRLRRIVAKLKVDYSAFGSTIRRFESLVQRLERNSPVFRAPVALTGRERRAPMASTTSGIANTASWRSSTCPAFPMAIPTVRIVRCMPAARARAR